MSAEESMKSIMLLEAIWSSNLPTNTLNDSQSHYVAKEYIFVYISVYLSRFMSSSGAYESGGGGGTPIFGANVIHFLYKVSGKRSVHLEPFIQKSHLKQPPLKKSFLRP